jgi:ParB-like chromosome segregation protein Spo0J
MVEIRKQRPQSWGQATRSALYESVKVRLAYAEDGMTLDQLMAFTVSGDHKRQEQVFERPKASYDKQPYAIRRMLTEGAIRASDKRAQFIGVDPYVAAGGTVLRDLFQGDDGGWLQDVALVDQMVADKLKADAEVIAAEGWKWIEVAPDLAYPPRWSRFTALARSATSDLYLRATRLSLPKRPKANG